MGVFLVFVNEIRYNSVSKGTRENKVKRRVYKRRYYD